MSSSEEIKHDGIVKSIEGNIAKVSIISKSACLSCQVKGACHVSDLSEKIIEVNLFETNFTVGENVTIALKESSGIKALIIGYMLPFTIMIATLITISRFTNNEILIGLGALGTLVPYYFSLFVLKDQIKKQFTFLLHKQ